MQQYSYTTIEFTHSAASSRIFCHISWVSRSATRDVCCVCCIVRCTRKHVNLTQVPARIINTITENASKIRGEQSSKSYIKFGPEKFVQ